MWDAEWKAEDRNMGERPENGKNSRQGEETEKLETLLKM